MAQRERCGRGRPATPWPSSQLKRCSPLLQPPLHLSSFSNERGRKEGTPWIGAHWDHRWSMGFFARNLRNTIVPNLNSMCSPTIGPTLSCAASIGSVFETWSVLHKERPPVCHHHVGCERMVSVRVQKEKEHNYGAIISPVHVARRCLHSAVISPTWRFILGLDNPNTTSCKPLTIF